MSSASATTCSASTSCEPWKSGASRNVTECRHGYPSWSPRPWDEFVTPTGYRRSKSRLTRKRLFFSDSWHSSTWRLELSCIIWPLSEHFLGNHWLQVADVTSSSTMSLQLIRRVFMNGDSHCGRGLVFSNKLGGWLYIWLKAKVIRNDIYCYIIRFPGYIYYANA